MTTPYDRAIADAVALWQSGNPDAARDTLIEFLHTPIEAEAIIIEQCASGTMEDVGKSVCVCDTCEYVDWDRRTTDGDECPACAEATNG